MINKVILLGRITKDPELRKTQSNKSYLNFTLACNRKYKNENGEYPTDFINCVAWNQSADYLSNYAHQGDMIGLEGTIQTRNYENNGNRVYVTEVLAENVSIEISKTVKERKEVTQTKNEQEFSEEPKYTEDLELPFY